MGIDPIAGQIRVTDLVTGRSRVVYASADQPGLIFPSPGARYVLLPMQPELVLLDLTTGKATDLPAGKSRLPALLYW